MHINKKTLENVKNSNRFQKTNQLLLQIRRQEVGGREVTASSCYEKTQKRTRKKQLPRVVNNGCCNRDSHAC